jgi:carboxyl-terminal processing protease
LKMLNGQDQAVEVAITAREEPGIAMQLGILPPMVAHLDHRRLKTPMHASIGLIKFNLWTPSILPEFDKAIGELRDSQGIIIDLRGNVGGLAGLVMGVGGHFTIKPEPLGILRFREGELTFATNPRGSTDDGRPVNPYSGPLAVLIDEASASTSEFFAGGMQTLKRARIFGQTSAGMALASQFEKLPNGDLLQYAMADFTMANGERVEGVGVKPDEEIAMSRKTLLAGEDVVLAAALKWIDTQVNK